ncbi:excinuclease ABC subunit UvrC [bacterium]|nr:excinuclease ABC subunit UvrC [bacterium]
MTLSEKLKMLPDQPGIYRFFARNGKIIYIGKAKNLKLRVRSYFLESQLTDYRVINLIPNIVDVEWVVTHTEAEALILEDKLIKTHKPKFNIQLKDDKSYPYFKLSISEKYPRLSLVREIDKDGSLYFGPYVSVTQTRAAWRIIRKYFPLRQSKMVLDGSRTYRPCLNYQLNRCLAPCAGLVPVEKYDRIVQSVLQLLKGNYEGLIDNLKTEMEKQSQALNFEEAAVIRDQITVVRQTLQKQRIVAKDKIDRDVFALIRSGGFAGVQILFIRNGILLSDDFFLYKKAEHFDDQEIIRSMLSRLYLAGDRFVPREILLPFPYDDATMFEDFCRQQKETLAKILVPIRGEKKALLDLAMKNGEQNLGLKLNAMRADEKVLEEVQQTLKLRNRPNRVECFDISNISGSNNVASMVVWEGNRSSKSNYRKYKIRTIDGANDYAAMEEVLSRRYRRLQGQDQPVPDLILIDGGKGQLSSAEKILSQVGVDLEKIDLIGLAKGRSEKRAGVDKGQTDFEYVVKPRRKNIIPLRKNSSTLYFLQNIRDEAHRFAISYFRKTHGKAGLKSGLEEIQGIGAVKRRKLLRQFKNMAAIRAAAIDDIQKVKGLSKNDALAVYRFFHPLPDIPAEKQNQNESR